MANKFFSYSFQVERTKKTGIIFVIFVVVLLVGAYFFYKTKNNNTSFNGISYNIVFGINEFESNDCDKAYRINSEKRTCGTICINILKQDQNYEKELRKNMEKNGFILADTTNKKINNYNWNYIKTSGVDPKINYYISNKSNKTYVVEYIDQTSYLPKKIKSSCNETTKKLLTSFKVK